MKYKLLALDLDGTLTNSSKKISKPTYDALIHIQEQGIKVVLASGRPIAGVLPLAKELKLKEYGGYILPFNGAKIVDCQHDRQVYNKLLSKDLLSPIYEFIKEYDVDVLGYTKSELLSGRTTNQYSEKESMINHMPIQKPSDFLATISAQDNNKLLITGDPAVIEVVEEKAKKRFRSALNIYQSEPFFLEMMPPNIDKAHSLHKLLSNLGLTQEEMICCGDGKNDVSMIEYAGLGVAMGNAQPIVKSSADFITKTNDEDGVLFVINQFMR